jgi:bifunctional UDP-N-acetylglucosamine pyrophosphorylase / glucosamine-1-phosphate N-acetyltransferase
MSLAVVLLAAGQGTRMLSKKQKILHQVGGKPMLLHIFEAAESVATFSPVVVVAPEAADVRRLLGERATYVTQAKPLGTGHAAMMAAPLLQGQSDQVIITYGDMPLLRAETLARLAGAQVAVGAAVALLSVMGEPGSSFGRVVRGTDGSIHEILEVAEAKKRPNTAELLALTELNAGVYCFDAAWLWQTLPHLPLRQARSGQEYYLTDMIELAVQEGRRVEAMVTADPDECLGAGTRAELVAVEKAFRRRANTHWLAHGVTLVDPDSTYLDPDITIGQDTVIWPNTYVQGRSTIGADCIIGPNTILRDAHIGRGCRVEQAVVEKATLADGTAVAPFQYIKD